MKSDFFKQKLFSVKYYRRPFPLKNVTVSVQFEVQRRINKWFWGFYKSDTLLFKNDFREILPRLEVLLDYRELYELKLKVESEMIDLKLSHRR